MTDDGAVVFTLANGSLLVIPGGVRWYTVGADDAASMQGVTVSRVAEALRARAEAIEKCGEAMQRTALTKDETPAAP